MEYVSFEGLRLDGRRAREIRATSIALGVDATADGSCEYALGHTRVLATVEGPVEHRASGAEGDAAPTCVVEARYRESAFARDGTREARKHDRRAQEFSRALTGALERAIVGTLMPRARIRVTTRVLADDGGARACAVNAATLALIDAGVPLRDMLAAVTVGLVDGHVLVDVNRAEERARGTELTLCAFAGGGATVEGDVVVGEQLDRGKCSVDVFENMHDLALAATRVVGARMRKATLKRTRSLAASRALEKF